MTDRLEEVYTFVRNYIAQHHRPPTLREIAKGCFTNTTTIIRYLDILQARGRLTREPGISRSLRLLDEDENTFS
jgi:SOS-response transcriptional repressor LexA